MFSSTKLYSLHELILPMVEGRDFTANLVGAVAGFDRHSCFAYNLSGKQKG